MFCVVSFVILSILSVFSAENRSLAREALDCVLRRVTLRPCNTGFDEKMKAKILGFVITKTETGARILNRFFEPLSWIFILLFLGSTFFAVRGVYLFYVTGSCNGLNQSGFCVFDPTGQSNQISNVGENCPVVLPGEDPVSLRGVNLSGFPLLNEGKEKNIVFIGSYGCEYSRWCVNWLKVVGQVSHFFITPSKRAAIISPKLVTVPIGRMLKNTGRWWIPSSPPNAIKLKMSPSFARLWLRLATTRKRLPFVPATRKPNGRSKSSFPKWSKPVSSAHPPFSSTTRC